jgi:signal transduction histidine kinase
MGIRTKIALGFVILTVAVITLVSFWGAQSLGFTVDSSDLIHLESIKNDVIKQLLTQQNLLFKQAKECQKAVDNIGINNLSDPKKLSDLIIKFKDGLNLDYAQIFEISNNSDELWQINSSKNYLISRLFNTGPLSHHGYLVSEITINPQKNLKLVVAKKPEIAVKEDNVFCIFDSNGILAGKDFLKEYSLDALKDIITSNSTKQIRIGDKLYRLRSFELNEKTQLITGYSTQVATLVKTEINNLMLRLAILEILGFLVLGYFWGKKIFEPMKTLQNSIDKVSEGQWEKIPPEITEKSYDEISTVAKSFNQMVNQLSTARVNLINAQKELAKKDKMATLGRFSAGIAHEINNPLGTILMSAGMIKESVDKKLPIEHEDITTIIEEVKRCRDIIENLRTYTRKTKPNLMKVLFKNFFEEMKEKVIKENEKGFSIGFKYEASDDLFIFVDKKAIQQVFNNVIKNAIEASDNINNLIINILAEETDKECIIKVLDNGKGFECEPENIFEPMFTTKAQGTGLGLVICQAIVEGHNGRIYAERDKEKELTCFNIVLPKASSNGLEGDSVEK